MRRHLIGVFVAVALFAVAGGTAHGDVGGTPTSIQQCFHGGWQQLIRDDGSPFENQGGCVSYLARGGSLGCPAPQVGPGPLTGGAAAGPGRFTVTGSGLSTFAAYYYVEVTLDGCGTVRFYNFETGGRIAPGGQLGQACPFGVFWADDTIQLRCYLIAGRTVRAITVYDQAGTPVGYVATSVTVPAMPSFSFGSPLESAPQQLTLPVTSANAEEIIALQLHYVPNMPGYSGCGSGSEFMALHFSPTDPRANPNDPIEVVSWSGGAITLDFSKLEKSEAYPGGFTLCGLVAVWANDVPAGTALPVTVFTFYG